MSPEDFLTWHEISLLPRGTLLGYVGYYGERAELRFTIVDLARDITHFHFMVTNPDSTVGWTVPVPGPAYAERSDFYSLDRIKTPGCECGALKCGHSGHSLWCPLHK